MGNLFISRHGLDCDRVALIGTGHIADISEYIRNRPSKDFKTEFLSKDGFDCFMTIEKIHL